MTQRAVEAVLGHLVTDERFRRDLQQDPVRASFEAGFTRAPVEAAALAAIAERDLALCGGRLDERVPRLDPSSDVASSD